MYVVSNRWLFTAILKYRVGRQVVTCLGFGAALSNNAHEGPGSWVEVFFRFQPFRTLASRAVFQKWLHLTRRIAFMENPLQFDSSASETLVSDAMAFGYRLSRRVNHDGLHSAGLALLSLSKGGTSNAAAIRGTLRRVLELLPEASFEDWSQVSVQGLFGTTRTQRFPIHPAAVRAALGQSY